jgi:hypothetical protein
MKKEKKIQEMKDIDEEIRIEKKKKDLSRDKERFIYVRIYMNMYVCMYMFMCLHVYMYIYMYVCPYVYMYSILTFIYINVYKYLYRKAYLDRQDSEERNIYDVHMYKYTAF